MVAHGKRRAAGAEGNPNWFIPACAILWRTNRPEGAVIEPDHAVTACRSKPGIGSECAAIDVISVICVAEDFGPFLIAVENTESVVSAKPSREISAIRGESKTGSNVR